MENTPAIGNRATRNPLAHPRIEQILYGIARDQTVTRQGQWVSRPKTKGLPMDMVLKLIDAFKDGDDKQVKFSRREAPPTAFTHCAVDPIYHYDEGNLMGPRQLPHYPSRSGIRGSSSEAGTSVHSLVSTPSVLSLAW